MKISVYDIGKNNKEAINIGDTIPRQGIYSYHFARTARKTPIQKL